MNLGEKIKSLRQKKGIGIKVLAENINVNYTYISKIENDKVTPSKDTIIRMAEYFNCNKDELLLAADIIPDDIKNILKENPTEAIEFIRRIFSSGSKS